MNKMKVNEFSVQFVEYMPDEILQGELYVSMKYSVVIHSCACGCGEKVVTPLSPDDWHLSYDGETISLKPSIGNWDFPCQSHYWIRENKVINAEAWDNQEAYKRTPWVSRKNSKLSKKKKGWKRFFEFIFS